MYELTHHEDDYDLRYRLKDKLYLPSAVSPSSSSAVPPINESKEESKRSDRSSRSSGVSDTRAGRTEGTGTDDSTIGESFLLVTWSNVILCSGRMLQLYDFSGAKV